MNTLLSLSEYLDRQTEYVSNNKVIFTILLTIGNFIFSIHYFEWRDLISEFIVSNTIHYNYFDVKSIGLIFYDGLKYTSQVGLHGLVFSIPSIMGATPSDAYFYALFLLVGFLFYYIHIAISILIKESYSSISAVLYFLLVAFSPIFIFNSNNLYWLYFLYLAPLFYTMKYFNIVKYKKFYLILSLILSVKYLATFEFISTIVLSCLIPTYYVLYKNKSRLREYIKHTWLLFVTSVVPFLIILIMFLLSGGELEQENSNKPLIKKIYGYGSGEIDISTSKSDLMRSNHFTVRDDMYASFAKKRNMGAEEDIDIVEKMNSYLRRLNTYKNRTSLLEYVSFNESKKKSLYSAQLIFCLLFTVVYVFLTIIKNNKRMELNSLLLAVSLLASISWPLIMPAHFYFHAVTRPGMAEVVLIIPFYGMVAVCLGDVLNSRVIVARRANREGQI